VVDEPAWVWLTSRGRRSSGTSFVPYTPKLGGLARIRAINEVRMHVAKRAPGASWVSSRALLREPARSGQRPKAVVEIGGERHAIEVELIKRTRERACKMIDAHSSRYDAVVCCCAPATGDSTSACRRTTSGRSS
jgi:hypothetical protein